MRALHSYVWWLSTVKKVRQLPFVLILMIFYNNACTAIYTTMDAKSTQSGAQHSLSGYRLRKLHLLSLHIYTERYLYNYGCSDVRLELYCCWCRVSTFYLAFNWFDILNHDQTSNLLYIIPPNASTHGAACASYCSIVCGWSAKCLRASIHVGCTASACPKDIHFNVSECFVIHLARRCDLTSRLFTMSAQRIFQ